MAVERMLRPNVLTVLTNEAETDESGCAAEVEGAIGVSEILDVGGGK